MFDCLGKHYTILTWTEDGIAIGEQTTSITDDTNQIYSTAEDLINNFRINGLALVDIIDKVKITYYS